MPTINDRYEILETLQRGPYGTTYLAEDQDQNRKVVLKQVVLADLPEGTGAFKPIELLEREGKILQHLNHPGIPDFFDAFETEDERGPSFWLVQEYRPGKDLNALIESGWRGSMEDILRILRDTAEILAYLHDRVPPIIHRDVKPHNIMFGDDGRISLVDFGAVATKPVTDHTPAGSTIVGTPGYVPLEQFAGRPQKASDVYALGMVGVFLLTHTDPVKLMGEDGRVHYRDRIEVTHPFLLDALDRMTAPMLTDRLPNMEAARRALAGESALVVRPSWARRYRRAAFATIALSAGITLSVLQFAGQTAPVPPAPGINEAVNIAPVPPSQPPDPLNGAPPDMKDVSPDPHGPLPPPVISTMRVTSPADNAPQDVSAQTFDMLVLPTILDPGRIRLAGVLDVRLQEEFGTDETGLIVDIDAQGQIHLVVKDACTEYGRLGATAIGPKGQYYFVCEEQTNDGEESVYAEVSIVYVLDPRASSLAPPREVARLKGTEDLERFHQVEDNFEMESMIGMPTEPLPRLIIPDRGPPLLLGYLYDYRDEFTPMVQPVREGAKPFSMASPVIEGASEVPLLYYLRQSRLHALYTRLQTTSGNLSIEQVPAAFSPRGTRVLPPLGSQSHRSRPGVCNGQEIRVRPSGIELSIPGEHGDATSVISIADARPLVGPTVSPASLDLCVQNKRRMQIGHAKGTYTLQFERQNLDYETPYVTCNDTHCLVLLLATEENAHVFSFAL